MTDKKKNINKNVSQLSNVSYTDVTFRHHCEYIQKLFNMDLIEVKRKEIIEFWGIDMAKTNKCAHISNNVWPTLNTEITFTGKNNTIRQHRPILLKRFIYTARVVAEKLFKSNYITITQYIIPLNRKNI